MQMEKNRNYFTVIKNYPPDTEVWWGFIVSLLTFMYRRRHDITKTIKIYVSIFLKMNIPSSSCPFALWELVKPLHSIFVVC